MDIKLFFELLITIVTSASCIALIVLFVIIPFIKRRFLLKNSAKAVKQISVCYDKIYCNGKIITIDALKASLKNSFYVTMYYFGNKRILLKKDIFGREFFNIEILNSIKLFSNQNKLALDKIELGRNRNIFF